MNTKAIKLDNKLSEAQQELLYKFSLLVDYIDNAAANGCTVCKGSDAVMLERLDSAGGSNG